MAKDVYWHLPGFCFFRFMYQVLFGLMKAYPECFKDGYKIGSVYGTFPGAIWNGGRAVFGVTSKQDMERLISVYNKAGVPVRFTWTNSLIEEKHLNDTYCNLIMRLADNGMNQALANRPVLEEYIRREYPNFKMISSTTKRIKDLETLKSELSKDYELVVLDYDLNHNEEVLNALGPETSRVEILVDEICYPNCPKRSEHYRDESLMQLEYSVGTSFECPNKNTSRVFEECKKRPAFISAEEIDSYIERGFVNFKLVGRGLPQSFVEDSIIYYLVKDESKDFIRKELDGKLAEIARATGQRR